MTKDLGDCNPELTSSSDPYPTCKPHLSWPTAPAKRTLLSVDQGFTYGKYFIVKT